MEDKNQTQMIIVAIAVATVSVLAILYFANQDSTDVSTEDSATSQIETGQTTSAQEASGQTEDSTQVSEEEEPSTAGENADTQVKEVTISIMDGSFSQREVNLKKGQTYKITVTNNGEETHSLSSSLISTGELEPGDSFTATITPNSAGSFKFFCDVPCPPFHSRMQAGYSFVVS